MKSYSFVAIDALWKHCLFPNRRRPGRASCLRSDRLAVFHGMKLITGISAWLVLLFLFAGCGPRPSPDVNKAQPIKGKLLAVSFQTMNNPFFVDLNEGLKKVVETHGDRLVTLDAQFNS